MEIIILSGGLGNQLFQHAFFLVKKKNNPAIKDVYGKHFNTPHNGYELNRLFGIKAHTGFFIQNIVRIIRKLCLERNDKISSFLLFLIKSCGIKIILKKNPCIFEQEVLKKRSGLSFYIGFWQTEKYFSSIRKEILTTFTFDKNMISPQTGNIVHLIKNTNSVSIHIRRGDYLQKGVKEIFGNICTPTYYDKAISEIKNRIDNPNFFVFSNDIEWVKENISIPSPNYIDWNKGTDSWQDMFLMSECKYNIIANSTFSWWGAWLNQNDNKIVIAPKRFLNDIETPDIFPEEWITI